MVESMTPTEERTSEYDMIHGTLADEQFIEADLAIQEHVDPSIVKPYRMSKDTYISSLQKPSKAAKPTPLSSSYDDLWSLEKDDSQEEQEKPVSFPPQHEKDILWFIEEYSSVLEPWQRDILTMHSDEMLCSHHDIR